MERGVFNSLRVNDKDSRTIANQMADQITWLIASGQVKSGEKLPTIRSLANHLGINLHTVRAAYQRLEERQLIRMRQGAGSVVLEFDPMLHAQKTNTHLTHTVGIIVPDLGNPFYPEFISGIEDVATDHNILLINCDSREEEVRGRIYLDMLVAKQVDGLIIAPYGLQLSHNQAADFLHHVPPVPTVFVDRPNDPGYCVLLDAEGAGYQATEHLIKDHGFNRIALITGSIEVPTLAQCYQGYRRALSEYDRNYDPEMVIQVDTFSYEKGYQAALQLMSLDQPPRAIFAAGDMLAIGAMRALHDKGIRIPEDVSVVGYNDIEISEFTQPRLTSVNTPTYELGVASMQMLYKLIQGEQVSPKTVTFPTKLMIRDSCGC